MAADGDRVIIVGGGLAGLTAACELIERGCNVTILDKERLGGNSSKATNGIAAPGSNLQEQAGISDDFSVLESDAKQPAGAASFIQSGVKDLEWLSSSLGFTGDLVLRTVPGHSTSRVVGTKEHFPGMVMTYKTVRALELIANKHPERIQILQYAEVKKLITDGNAVVGVEYELAGETSELMGPVVIATGGFAGDRSPEGLIAANRPDLVNLSSTNDDRSSGDGIKLSSIVGAATADMDKVHVTPMALVRPGAEDSQLNVVASDAILGAGGILLNSNGARFCDELSHDDCRTRAMMNNQGPFYLVIGETASAPVDWLTKFYTSKGVMKKVSNVDGLAKEIQTSSVSTLKENLTAYCEAAAKHSAGTLSDDVANSHFLFGAHKRSFGSKTLEENDNIIDINDNMYVAVVSPALYTCGGGLVVENARVLTDSRQPIDGLYAAGEVVTKPNQPVWSLSGVPLLHCIASGRAAGRAVAEALNVASDAGSDIRSLIVSASIGAVSNDADAKDGAEVVGAKDVEEMSTEELKEEIAKLRSGAVIAAPADAAPAEEESGEKEFGMDEVAKHNTQADAWVVINDMVIDVTNWIPIHPGGVQAICAFIGKDASDEWNTIHKPGTVQQKALVENGPIILGKLKGGGGGAAAAPVEITEPPPEGHGYIPGVFGAFCYMIYNWLRLILKTVFFTGNFKLTGDRTGTVRSAVFLVLFIAIHAVGNLEIYLGKPEYNGYAYFYERLYWTGFGLPANIVEEYLAVCLFVHVSVALRRSYEITINYCLNTGKWRMLLTGLCTLSFLIKHVQDFRFAKAEMVQLIPPPYYFSFDGVMSGRFWFELPESGIEPVWVRDVAGLVVNEFQNIWSCLYYTLFICLFMIHILTGWGKMAPSETFFLPRGHVKAVTYIGQGFISCLGLIYLSFPWYIYFTGVDGIPSE